MLFRCPFFRCPYAYFMPRQNVYTVAMSAAETGLSHLADYLAEAKVESLKGKKLDEIREKIKTERGHFLSAKGDLMNEIKALEVNPGKNKELIGELKKALAKSEETAQKFNVLNNLLSSDDALIGAVKSGLLTRTLRETAALVSKTHKIIDDSHAALGSLGAEKAGIVEINQLKALEGKMRFYMYNFVPGKGVVEVEIKVGDRIPVSSFPISIRASVEDEMKTKFRNLKSSGTLPGGTVFNDVSDATDGHKFSYTNERVGTTTWVSKEEYTWEPDNADTKKKLTRLSQRNSDPSTEMNKGDVVEIWTVVPAQKLGFYVTAKTNVWKRRSLLNNKETLGEQVPSNNVGKAYINISVFPR